MKIALIGYGKMGKAIEQIALQRGHEIVAKVSSNPQSWSGIEEADVAIEFSLPSSAVSNLQRCMRAEIPVVCGTTGWLAALPEVESFCIIHDGALLYASNFSIGVNIFFEINKKLATLLHDFPQYEGNMTEIHHIHKLDAPSGTAISLANDIIAANPKWTHWTGNDSPLTPGALPIKSVREQEVPGTHTIVYRSGEDSITISHEAHNRHGFATGAIVAAEWIVGKKGIFSMGDVLGI